MRITWQDYDEQMAFEKVLEKIRSKELGNVKVHFEQNAGRLHYKFDADIDDKLAAEMLGFRVPPR
jgi:hypothetical protein